MHYILEDPWPIVTVCGIVAVAALIALRVSQQGKFLLFALIALAIGAAELALERLWVTDSERIEDVVHGLAHDVQYNDPDAALARLTPDVVLSVRNASLEGQKARDSIAFGIKQTHFDIISISKLEVTVQTQARHGTAEFKALTAGRFGVDMIQSEFPPNTTDWSLGFEETSPGVWKVDRINLTRSPRGFIGLPQAR